MTLQKAFDRTMCPFQIETLHACHNVALVLVHVLHHVGSVMTRVLFLPSSDCKRSQKKEDYFQIHLLFSKLIYFKSLFGKWIHVFRHVQKETK